MLRSFQIFFFASHLQKSESDVESGLTPAIVHARVRLRPTVPDTKSDIISELYMAMNYYYYYY